MIKICLLVLLLSYQSKVRVNQKLFMSPPTPQTNGRQSKGPRVRLGYHAGLDDYQKFSLLPGLHMPRARFKQKP